MDHNFWRILTRVLLVGAFLATGLFVLGHGMSASTPPAALHTPAGQALPQAQGPGLGAGEAAAAPARAAIPAGCGIFDVTCLAQEALAAILAPVTSTLTTFISSVLTNLAHALSPSHAGARAAVYPADSASLNFLTQTPLCFVSFLTGCNTQDPLDVTLGQFVTWAQSVAGAALAFVVVIGGFNLLLGRQMGMRVHDLSELIPRVILTYLAAVFAPLIVQAFISFNNLLCLSALATVNLGGFTGMLSALAAPAAPFNWLALLFVIAAVVMAVLLLGQMAFRLALVALLGCLAPIGLLCFALPQTLSWGRLWLQQFSLAVFIQLVQVVALALGGMLLAALATATASFFGGVTDGTAIVQALLLIVLFYLAFRLPTMIQAYSGRYVTNDLNRATVETLEGVGQLVTEAVIAAVV